MKSIWKMAKKDFSVSLYGIGRFRISCLHQRSTSAAAIRVLSFNQPDPGVLRIPQRILDFHQRTKGLVLVTGPTGSGKSTTLSAIINLINEQRECHILTLEDPIEYLHKHQKSLVDQREIGMDTKSYSNALRSALRQAPDVIQVGEMRDLETIAIPDSSGNRAFSVFHPSYRRSS